MHFHCFQMFVLPSYCDYLLTFFCHGSQVLASFNISICRDSIVNNSPLTFCDPNGVFSSHCPHHVMAFQGVFTIGVPKRNDLYLKYYKK